MSSVFYQTIEGNGMVRSCLLFTIHLPKGVNKVSRNHPSIATMKKPFIILTERVHLCLAYCV